MGTRNIVGHCYNPVQNKDKVYMCGVRQSDDNGKPTWTVIAKWGRRNNTLQNQIKGTFPSEAQALQSMQSVWKSKASEGYLEIESTEYKNKMASSMAILKMTSPGIKENLELENGEVYVTNAPTQTQTFECDRCGIKFSGQAVVDSQNRVLCPSCQKKVAELNKNRLEKMEDADEVMVCIDNSGMEDRFDIGIEYLIEQIPDKDKSKEMIYVYDKLGCKDEYFKARFTTPEKYAKSPKMGVKEFFEVAKLIMGTNSINLGPVMDDIDFDQVLKEA